MATPTCTDYRDLPSEITDTHGTMYRVSEAVGAQNGSLSIIHFDPGDGGPLSYHAEPTEEFYVVVSGTFEIQLDDETFRADEGAVAYIPPGCHHRPVNVTDEPAVLLVVQTPSAEDTTYLD